MFNKFKLALYSAAILALDVPPYNPVPGGLNIPPSGPAVTLRQADNLLRTVGNALMTYAIIFAVIMLTWGGISYMLAQSDSTKIKAAQDRTKNAIIGAAIALGVGLIIKTIYSVITGSFFCWFSFGPFCIRP